MGHLPIRQHPERELQDSLILFLGARGWFVRQTHGSAFQTGFPDLFIYHPRYGYRWVDCKVAGRYSFTRAQKVEWPKWDAAGVGIWILTSTDEYERLFGPPNWRDYWRDSWGTPDIDALLDTL